MIDRCIWICLINAFAKFPRKKGYSEYTKYEPDNEADKQDIQNGRYGADESVDHHLRETKRKKNVPAG